MRWMAFVLFVLVLGLCPSPAHAGLLLGETILADYRSPDLSTVNNAFPAMSVVVGPGLEINNWTGLFDVDLDDTSLTFTSEISFSGLPASFNGFRFYDVNGTIPAWTASLDPLTDPDFGPARLTFDDDHIWLNLASIPVQPIGFTVKVNLAPVPEPGSLALLLGGVGAVSLRRRRR